jgi:hypothetical protein
MVAGHETSFQPPHWPLENTPTFALATNLLFLAKVLGFHCSSDLEHHSHFFTVYRSAHLLSPGNRKTVTKSV